MELIIRPNLPQGVAAIDPPVVCRWHSCLTGGDDSFVPRSMRSERQVR